ncbi:MAG: RimK/LysX family protein [Melioribacteraceae bacterium]|nr:RimK/LysX family protein [Melioribacteraceae bacterium]MCF8263543.1 RimK/LysX family protein [Melioribacteraceae bacterium]MCF8413511.1 RimK/LysX family protein [Melioribacteraceae bacterium]MCF8430669.1 RimK/LysX family protein [Melioribacteraceae bacterium]
MSHKNTIQRFESGWREWVALPELKIPSIKVKLDTGARTSSLHTFDLETFEVRGQLRVKFGVHPIQRSTKAEIFCTADVIDTRIVKNSGGHLEERYVIKTPIIFGEHQWPIEITLSNREDMKFRMLLGREAMRKRVSIIPDKSYLTGRKLAKHYHLMG